MMINQTNYSGGTILKDIKIEAAETVSLFCRLNQRVKKELPIRSSEMGLLILLVTSKERICGSGPIFQGKQTRDHGNGQDADGKGLFEKGTPVP